MIGDNKKLTHAEFITRAQTVHGVGRYDYSQAVYIGVKYKLTIICPAHGSFEQEAGSHLSGCGCRRCSNTKAGAYLVPTKGQFIEKAIAKHGSVYDYSSIHYAGDKSKISIGCPVHGIFEQSAGNHLQGQGCPQCGFKKSGRYSAVSTPSFIARAVEVHGQKYQYTNTEYTKATAKVKINCPLHGEFLQLPGQHLRGKGCSACGNLARAEATRISNTKWNTDSFRTRCKELHPHLDFSKAIYSPERGHKVHYDCPLHGPRVADQHSLLAGRGCGDCRYISNSGPKKTREQWIADFQEAHGNKYAYESLPSSFIGTEKVDIKCLLHGVFQQQAHNHRQGFGCPMCGRESLSQSSRLSWIEKAAGRIATLYLVRLFSKQEAFFKIGITFLSTELRYRSASRLGGYQYEILAEHKSSNAARVYDWEQSILQTFSHLQYKPANYFQGETECFSSCDEILAIFPL